MCRKDGLLAEEVVVELQLEVDLERLVVHLELEVALEGVVLGADLGNAVVVVARRQLRR